MSSPPFFVVGAQRSGTTLLRIILASHSRLSIGPETWFLDQLTDLLEVDGPLSQQQIERVIRTITGHFRWRDLDLDEGEFRRDVTNLQRPGMRDIVEWVFLKGLARDGKERWGDKTPGYIEIVPQIAKLFPGAKFIELIRDGRDVAKSYQVLRWNEPWLHANARNWLDAMECSSRWSNCGVSQHILQVHYEDLVLDSERTVRRICDFLDEDFEPEMLAWPKNVDDLIPARGAKMHKKLKRMPLPTDVYRWRNEFSSREIFVCEAFMGQYLEAQGYELRFAGTPWNIVFPITRWYCRYVLPVATIPIRALRKARRLLSARPSTPDGLNAPAES